MDPRASKAQGLQSRFDATVAQLGPQGSATSAETRELSSNLFVLQGSKGKAEIANQWCSVFEMRELLTITLEFEAELRQKKHQASTQQSMIMQLYDQVASLREQKQRNQKVIDESEERISEALEKVRIGENTVEQMLEEKTQKELHLSEEKKRQAEVELQFKEKESVYERSLEVCKKELADVLKKIENEEKSERDQQDEQIAMSRKVIVKPTQFYHVVLRYFEFGDLVQPDKGWQLYLNAALCDPDNPDSETIPDFAGISVAVIGDYNRGKTWLLARLTDCYLPDGDLATTPGICAKAVDVDSSRFIILDTAGLNSPVNSVQDLALKEKKAEEGLLRDVSFRMCSTYLYVVNNITAKEQLEIFQLSRDLYLQKKRTGKDGLVIVIHNLRNAVSGKQLRLHFDRLRNTYGAEMPVGYSADGHHKRRKAPRLGSTVEFSPPGAKGDTLIQGVIEAVDDVAVVIRLHNPTPEIKLLLKQDDPDWAPEGEDLCYIARSYWETVEVNVLHNTDRGPALVSELLIQEFPVMLTYFEGNKAVDGASSTFFEMQKHFVLGKEGTEGGENNDATFKFIRNVIKNRPGMGDTMNFLSELEKGFNGVLPRYFNCGGVGHDEYRAAIKILPPSANGGPRKVFAYAQEMKKEENFDSFDSSAAASVVSKAAPELLMRGFELGTYSLAHSQNKTIPYGVFRGYRDPDRNDAKPLQMWTFVFEVPGMVDENVRITFEDDAERLGSKKLVFSAKKPKPEDLARLHDEGLGTLVYEEEPAPIEIPVNFQMDNTQKITIPPIRNGILRFTIQEADIQPEHLLPVPERAALDTMSLRQLLDLAKMHELDTDDCESKVDFVQLLDKSRLC